MGRAAVFLRDDAQVIAAPVRGRVEFDVAQSLPTLRAAHRNAGAEPCLPGAQPLPVVVFGAGELDAVVRDIDVAGGDLGQEFRPGDEIRLVQAHTEPSEDGSQRHEPSALPTEISLPRSCEIRSPDSPGLPWNSGSRTCEACSRIASSLTGRYSLMST